MTTTPGVTQVPRKQWRIGVNRPVEENHCGCKAKVRGFVCAMPMYDAPNLAERDRMRYPGRNHFRVSHCRHRYGVWHIYNVNDGRLFDGS